MAFFVAHPVLLPVQAMVNSSHLSVLTKKVSGWLKNNMDAEKTAFKTMGLFDKSVDIGLIILTQPQIALNAPNGMACSHLTEIR
jgi:beta-aspartyl-peptidase (threonine type)